MNQKPIAPDCKQACPLIVEYPDGSEEASYCEDCTAYLSQTVTTKNAEQILQNQEG